MYFFLVKRGVLPDPFERKCLHLNYILYVITHGPMASTMVLSIYVSNFRQVSYIFFPLFKYLPC